MLKREVFVGGLEVDEGQPELIGWGWNRLDSGRF